LSEAETEKRKKKKGKALPPSWAKGEEKEGATISQRGKGLREKGETFPPNQRKKWGAALSKKRRKKPPEQALSSCAGKEKRKSVDPALRGRENV